MFSLAVDVAHGLVLFLFTGPTNEDDDFRAYVDCLRELKTLQDEWAAESSRISCAVLVVDPGNPIPNARWRRAIAEASADFRPPALFAIASASPLVRGAITAINWLRPPPFDVGIFATFEEAVAWAEARRGVRLPTLDALAREARRLAEEGVHTDDPRFHRASSGRAAR